MKGVYLGRRFYRQMFGLVVLNPRCHVHGGAVPLKGKVLVLPLAGGVSPPLPVVSLFSELFTGVVAPTTCSLLLVFYLYVLPVTAETRGGGMLPVTAETA